MTISYSWEFATRGSRGSGIPGSGWSAGGSALVTWDSVTGASYYRVYYGTSTNIYDQAFGSGINVGNVTSYTITGLNAGTTYYIVVTATDSGGNESDWSNETTKVAA